MSLQKQWTAHEEQLLSELWASTRLDLEKAFPSRSWESLRKKAKRLGLDASPGGDSSAPLSEFEHRPRAVQVTRKMRDLDYRLSKLVSPRVAFVPDIHYPYHDPAAVAAAERVLRHYKPDLIVLLGDVVDFYELSDFDKNPNREKRLQDELNQADDFFFRLRRDHPTAAIWYKEGNHEKRLQRYLWKYAKGLSSLTCLETSNLLRLPKHDIRFFTTKEKLRFGGAIITHGDRVRQKSGYTAHSMLWDRKMSGISGHTHRFADVSISADGGTWRWIEAGCLCRLDPEYVDDKIPDWQQGMVLGTYSARRDRLDFTMVRVLEGEAYFDGKFI